MASLSVVLSPAARLPVELVEMICDELAVLDQWLTRAGTSRSYGESQSAALAAAALVCRKWAGPAQTALLRSLSFASNDECVDFLDAMEHNPRLLDVPRAVDFGIGGHQLCELPFDIPKHIVTILEKCGNIEFIHIYAECNISSPGFDYAIRHLQHLRKFVFESNPMIGHSNRWFNESIRQLPMHVRVVGAYDDAVELDVVFDLPFDLDLLEYRSMRDEPYTLLDDLDDLLETVDRPFRVSQLNVHVEPDPYIQSSSPVVSVDVVKNYTARFAARGVVFRLLESAW